MKICIRKFDINDTNECIALFRGTVHSVNAKDYTPSQLAAWAPENIDSNSWQKRLTDSLTYIAEVDNQIIGFGNMTTNGYLDMLFIHKNFQRKGIAKKIVIKLEEIALELGLKEVSTESSITAKPFFETMGYHILEQQLKEHRGEQFINFVMKKQLV